MAKRLSESSQPVRLKRMRSEDTKSRRLTDRESEVIRVIAERQTAGDDASVKLTDIPRLSDRQLAAMVRLREGQTEEDSRKRSSG